MDDLYIAVTAGMRIDALHHWPEASGMRSYLGQPHMHDFRIEVSAVVDHDNREIEFHDLRGRLKLVVLDLCGTFGVADFGSRSCEQIGEEILRYMPEVVGVSVYEDEFCGAIVHRVPQEKADSEGVVWSSYAPPRHLTAHNIITLCGSTRFKKETLHAAHKLAAEGWIVEMVEFFTQAEGITISEEAKQRVDQIHKDKIRSSHAIYVVNPGGYVGDSTRSEINLAMELRLPVLWLEKPTDAAWQETMRVLNMRS